PAERVAHLRDYLAPADAVTTARQLARVFGAFGADARVACAACGIEFPAELERAVRASFASRCAPLVGDTAAGSPVDVPQAPVFSERKLP
ncbi:MAG TPA: hypothetical protein VK178_17770, partial [Opitutaceae bacterium]|nr:hypothetical protein [Opitutaceae bacterium]